MNVFKTPKIDLWRVPRAPAQAGSTARAPRLSQISCSSGRGSVFLSARLVRCSVALGELAPVSTLISGLLIIIIIVIIIIIIICMIIIISSSSSSNSSSNSSSCCCCCCCCCSSCSSCSSSSSSLSAWPSPLFVSIGTLRSVFSRTAFSCLYAWIRRSQQPQDRASSIRRRYL